MIGENMYLYLAMSNTAISSALAREEETVQKPVYYTSQGFPRAEANYPKLDKIAFALVVASRKLCPYFQAYPIIVMTNQRIRKRMNKINVVGLLV